MQVQRDYLKGLYVLEPKEAIWLTALQVQAHRREAGIDDLLTSSRELELIVQQYSPAEVCHFPFQHDYCYLTGSHLPLRSSQPHGSAAMM